MKFLRRLRYWFREREMQRDLAEEIEFHHVMAGDPNAMRNVTLAREDVRAVWIWPWLQSVFQDITYAIRNLRPAQLHRGGAHRAGHRDRSQYQLLHGF